MPRYVNIIERHLPLVWRKHPDQIAAHMATGSQQKVDPAAPEIAHPLGHQSILYMARLSEIAVDMVISLLQAAQRFGDNGVFLRQLPLHIGQTGARRNAGFQLRRVHRLHQKIIRPRAKPLGYCVFFLFRGQKDHIAISARFIVGLRRAYRRAQFWPGSARHQPVTDHQFRVMFLIEPKRFITILGLKHPISPSVEIAHQNASLQRAVLGDKRDALYLWFGGLKEITKIIFDRRSLGLRQTSYWSRSVLFQGTPQIDHRAALVARSKPPGKLWGQSLNLT